ncbi:MAG: DUF308 domain-containing protein [Eubacterium sp.]|nr:DUF308 domain-containing protein [Eubacterium sp.]
MKILEHIKRISLVTVVLGFVAGILFIAYPDKCIKYISLAVGVVFISLAVASVINYLLDRSSAFTLVCGIILGIIGIIICARYKQVISFIVVVIGIFIIGAGIINLVTGLKTVRRSLFFGWFTLLSSVAVIVFGVIAVLNSTALSESLVRIIGVGLIIYAVLDLVAFFEVRSIVREAKKTAEALQDVETDATVVEEEPDGAYIETDATIVGETEE